MKQKRAAGMRYKKQKNVSPVGHFQNEVLQWLQQSECFDVGLNSNVSRTASFDF